MFPTLTPLLTVAILALSVAANPVLLNTSPVTLPISRRIGFTGIHNLLQHDQARARSLKSRGRKPAVNTPITNEGVTYVASVGVGNPPTTYQLLVDSGSSNTWVGAGKPYQVTKTSEKTPDSVSVSYGSGSFSGTEYIDEVTLAPGLVIPHQSIGVASTFQGFDTDGILGVGPVDLTLGTLSPNSGSTIPTVTDNLFSDRTISENLIGMSFEPTTTTSDVNGEISWGGTDFTKYIGPITFVPITTTSPASNFWGIDQSISYGSTNILSTTAGIVDTGTTLILIATDAFQKYESATGGVPDSATGLLSITSSQFSNLHSLFFRVGETTFELTANAQIWPRSLNSYIGGVSSKIYLITADIGTPSGSGLDFINGYAFLERFYSVFDTANRQVGLAQTLFTHAETN